MSCFNTLISTRTDFIYENFVKHVDASSNERLGGIFEGIALRNVKLRINWKSKWSGILAHPFYEFWILLCFRYKIHIFCGHWNGSPLKFTEHGITKSRSLAQNWNHRMDLFQSSKSYCCKNWLRNSNTLKNTFHFLCCKCVFT